MELPRPELESDMKIDERISNYMSLLTSDAEPLFQNSGDASGAPKTAVPAPDAVAISSTAAHLAEDEGRRERLNAIRQQLAEGSYNISGKDVAEKILNVLKG
jgi:anti-sigma28 factor (negative regulator of flagellin synthesis)